MLVKYVKSSLLRFLKLKNEKQQQREEIEKKRYLNALKKIYKIIKPYKITRNKLVEAY